MVDTKLGNLTEDQLRRQAARLVGLMELALSDGWVEPELAEELPGHRPRARARWRCGPGKSPPDVKRRLQRAGRPLHRAAR